MNSILSNLIRLVLLLTLLSGCASPSTPYDTAGMTSPNPKLMLGYEILGRDRDYPRIIYGRCFIENQDTTSAVLVDANPAFQAYVEPECTAEDRYRPSYRNAEPGYVKLPATPINQIHNQSTTTRQIEWKFNMLDQTPFGTTRDIQLNVYAKLVVPEKNGEFKTLIVILTKHDPLPDNLPSMAYTTSIPAY